MEIGDLSSELNATVWSRFDVLWRQRKSVCHAGRILEGKDIENRCIAFQVVPGCHVTVMGQR